MGVKRGIESVTTFMLPTLFILLIMLVIYGHIEGEPGRAWQFMFSPDFSSLTWRSLLMALGQALFSITVGTGALLTLRRLFIQGYLPARTLLDDCSQ